MLLGRTLLAGLSVLHFLKGHAAFELIAEGIQTHVTLNNIC